MATPRELLSPRDRRDAKLTNTRGNNGDNDHEHDAALERDARHLEQQLLVAFRGAETTAAVLSTADARANANANANASASATGPSALRTALCFDALRHVATMFPRFDTVMRHLETELTRAVYVSYDIKQQQQQRSQPHRQSRDEKTSEEEAEMEAFRNDGDHAVDEAKNNLSDEGDNAERAARIQRFFTRRTFFAQLHRVLSEKATLQTELEGLDRMRGLMLLQLRHKELMVDRLATRWGRVLLKQTLVDWRQIIVRKKYTRVLLEKTSGRWSRQRLLRLFRRWADTTKTQKVARMSQKLQQCVETTRDLEDLLSKMDAQIDSARLETKGHREHFDFAKRQIVSLEELLAQLETRVHSCNERKLQALVNEWGKLCLSFVDVQVEYLQHMLSAVTAQEFVDATGILAKGEELSDLVQLPSDLLVLRWINYQLARCDTFQCVHPKAVASALISAVGSGSSCGGGFIQNFSSDMKNHYVLRHILKRIQTRREEVLRTEPLNAKLEKRSLDDAAHDNSVTEMTAAEFVEALVHIAQSKHFRLKSNRLLQDATKLTPEEFLRDFYTRRGLYDKLKDVDALVSAYSKNMPQLYAELDKKYGTTFSTNPPPITEEVRRSEPVSGVPALARPASPRASVKPAVNKIIMLGNSGVGKTNLLSRLNKGEFSDDFTSTVGVEFLTHIMNVDGMDVKAQIWDTAGQERFHAMMATYYRKAVGALLIFDVTDRLSFLGVEKWLEQLLNVAEPGLHAVLVGNKCDITGSKRVVTSEEAQQFASAHHMSYVETSAKSGQNVESAFHSLITAIHRSQLAEMASAPQAPPLSTVELSSAPGSGGSNSTNSIIDCNLF
ncbi:hypothetical protein P43SY_006774 [Pythium insidiosum]|uniref:Rab11 family GTPase n=1 Tax=Pythium insidiosum TaxID=114742 RepID=A0AAD5LQK5_PYTIN|nr:hypothetical protein P43SY_006774 [Pythium insidiosum]